MPFVTTLKDLTDLYGAPSDLSLQKVVDHLTPAYQTWIAASPVLVLSTVGSDGVSTSPRGDRGPVVRIDDPHHVLLPDWRGNNRLDSLRNIVEDGRVSLMFMIPGCANVVRVVGHARLSIDVDLLKSFDHTGKTPTTVIVIQVQRAYFQCAKAIMRSGLWDSTQETPQVPTAGDFLKEVKQGFDGQEYDAAYPAYAKSRMW